MRIWFGACGRPLPVHPPLPIFGNDGTLLNKPEEPYAGRYEGDEDTRRKAAYHNGTAWTWTFPVFCEALAQAFWRRVITEYTGGRFEETRLRSAP